jgi:two-component system NtrC family sensor kinase
MTALPPDVVANLERENARLQAELRAARDRQTASAEIQRTIADSPGDAERSLRQIAETTARLFGAPSVTVMIAEDDQWGKTIRVGDGSKHIGSNVSAEQLRIGGPNLPGTVVHENRQIHIPDLDNVDPAMAHWPGPPLARAAGAQVVSGTPLRREGRAIGALIVFRDRPLPFTAEELALQQSFADQAVIAIENARLFNETREALARQTATSEILRVISQSPTDVQPVFDAIVLAATRLFRRDMAFILGCDATTYWAVATAGREGLLTVPHVAPVAINTDANFPSRVIVTGKNLHLPDWSAVELPEYERMVHETLGINSALYLPLLREGKCVGLLGIAGKRAGIFGESEIALAESFRDQALIAIENTRLFNETKETLERQTATAEILKVIASSPNDVQPVFDVIVERAVRLCGGRMGRVYRYDDGIIHLVAGHGLSVPGLSTVQQVFPRPAADDTTAGRAIQSRRPNFVTDIENDESVAALSRQMIEALGTRSQVTVPMLRTGEPIGAITVGWADPGAYGDQQVTLLQTFADQAVIAIENVRLFNETKEALERQTATADILKVIASSPSDVQPVFEAIATSANRLLGGFSTTVFRFIEGALHLMAFTPTNAAADEALKASFPSPVASFPILELVHGGEAVQIPDTEASSDAPLTAIARSRGFRSMLFTPLMSDGIPIGMIGVTRLEPGSFATHHVQLLKTFADQAVIAIENVRLFDEVQARTRELAASLDDLRTAQDRLVQTEKLASLGQLTAGIAHEIKNPLNFVNNFSALSAELTDELNDVLKSAALDDKARNEVEELTQLLKDNLQKIVQHGKRADSIVKNMLLHSREGSGEHRPADINALLDESLNLAYHGARAEKPQFNVTLRRDFDDRAGTIELFPQEITRVFLNLISNGFYAVTKRKTEIGNSGFEPVLSATTKNLGNTVEIRIRDNGTGIPAEVKDKMFNPFFTTKPAGEGTGLGLSMSHDIVVKQHGGTIDVETEPGRFTEFRIVLPRTRHVSKQNSKQN